MMNHGNHGHTSNILESNVKCKVQPSCCVGIIVCAVVLHDPPSRGVVLRCGHQLQTQRGAPGRGEAQFGKAARGVGLLPLDLLDST